MEVETDVDVSMVVDVSVKVVVEVVSMVEVMVVVHGRNSLSSSDVALVRLLEQRRNKVRKENSIL